MPSRVVAYTRVSTEEQSSEGVSLDAQAAKVRAYCAMRGLDLVEVVVDAAVSAGKPLASRPGGSRVADAVRRGEVDGVVAVRLDRLFRDAADCLTATKAWEAKGVALHLVDLGGASVDTTSAAGRFMLTVLAGAAEMERNLVRERTRDALAHKRSRGERMGSIPFGYRPSADGKLEAEPAEVAVVARVRALAGQGLSQRGIAAALAAEGVVSPRSSRPLRQTQVASILARAA